MQFLLDYFNAMCYHKYMSMFEQNDFGFHETYSSSTTNVSYEKHMHNYYELYYFLEGNADYIVGNTVYHLQPHDLLFIRPSLYHYLKLLSDTPYHRIVINFTTKHLTEAMQNDIESLQTHYRVPTNRLISQYYNNSINIINRYNEVDTYDCLIQFLNQILTELKYSKDLTDQESPAIIHPLFGKILTFIDQNLNQELNVHILSEKFFISPSWIMHAFRDFLNISAMEYINRKKILFAQQLISSGVPPMTAAEQCNFKNYSTFYTQYKKILGIPPMKSKYPK